jgi:hypothetical protein
VFSLTPHFGVETAHLPFPPAEIGAHPKWLSDKRLDAGRNVTRSYHKSFVAVPPQHVVVGLQLQRSAAQEACQQRGYAPSWVGMGSANPTPT